MADPRPKPPPSELIIASASTHITAPHLSTHEDAAAYEALLAALRKDLQLDAATDILPGSILPVIMPGTALKYLLDTAGTAPFLQLLSAQKLQLAFGSGTLVWPGASNQSNQFTQAHGLSGTPKAYGAFSNGLAPGGLSFYMFSQTAADATNVYLLGRGNAGSNPSAGTGGAFTWWAIG